MGFMKPDVPPPPPPPPPPPIIPAEVVEPADVTEVQKEKDKLAKRYGKQRTILTQPQGLVGNEDIASTSLLGS